MWGSRFTGNPGNNAKKIPVTMLSGFLGAGRNRLVPYNKSIDSRSSVADWMNTGKLPGPYDSFLRVSSLLTMVENTDPAY